jgi:hypothetical protein
MEWVCENVHWNNVRFLILLTIDLKEDQLSKPHFPKIDLPGTASRVSRYLCQNLELSLGLFRTQEYTSVSELQCPRK